MNSFAINITLLGVILLCGVALNRFSRFMKMPILICFLGVGILFGRFGLNWIPPDLQMSQVQIFGEIALCFIIFSGGLQTSFRSIKSVFVTGTILSTVGVVLTALLLAFCILLIDKLPLFIRMGITESILVSAVFASTDAAAVFAILRGQKAAISPKLQSLLEYESGSNDPAAFLLTSVMIQIVKAQSSFDIAGISLNIAGGIIWGLGIGAITGFLLGIFGQWFYNWVQSFLEYSGLRLVVAVAIVLVGFGIADGLLHANSLMACYVAGITMGNMRFNFKTTFAKFQDGLSWLMQILLFTLLGAFFDCRMLFNVRNMIAAMLISLSLMFVVRPLVVMLCMIRSPFNFRERLFTSWVGIRGSAPIMLAALVASSLPEEWSLATERLFHMTFTVVLLSILFQGSSLMWVAKKLGLVLPYQEKPDALLEYDERADDHVLFQFTVTARNQLANCALERSGLSGEPVLLMIKRGAKFIQPLPKVVLSPNDILTFLGTQGAMQELHDQFFPEEDYVPVRTFRQLWRNFSKKYVRKRRNAGKKHA